MSENKVVETVVTETPAKKYLPTTPDIPTVCQPGDKECLARLVQAFSDCD